jgi:phosphoglycolate phosphatase
VNDLSTGPLVFDLDGTLIDSRRDIAAACNHALVAIGRDPLPLEEITVHVGSGARALLVGVLGENVAARHFEELLTHFQSYYAAHPIDHNELMPGAAECLALRSPQRPVALCTNKPLHLTTIVLRALGWSDVFDVVVAPAPGDRTKPHPDLLVRVAESLGVKASRLIMIGDSPQDVGAGKAVGAHTVGVKGGLLPLERLVAAEPDVILDSLLALPDYLTAACVSPEPS